MEYKCVKCRAAMGRFQIRCSKCGELALFRWPVLGAVLGSVLFAGLGVPLVNTFGIRSGAGKAFAAATVIGVAVAWYYGVSIALLDRRIAKAKASKEASKREGTDS